jgi:hypothetical protein
VVLAVRKSPGLTSVGLLLDAGPVIASTHIVSGRYPQPARIFSTVAMDGVRLQTRAG